MFVDLTLCVLRSQSCPWDACMTLAQKMKVQSQVSVIRWMDKILHDPL